jgi:predicted TIM-barrel fold metal-dependent hydrolase
MIIDCHAHLLPAWRMAKLIDWTVRFNPGHPVPRDVTLATLLDEYRRVGVERVWNLAHAIFPDESENLNRWNHELGLAHPEIVPIGTCHPATPDPLAVIDRCLTEYRFIGMKFHPFVQRFTPWEPRFMPFYERIEAHGGLVIFHTGFEEFYGGALPIEGFRPILEAFPRLLVVFAHANYPHVDAALDMLSRYPNLYLDTVHVFARLTASWAAEIDQGAIWARLRDGISAFPDRIMFGTDHPSGTGHLIDMYRDVRAFGLAPELEARLLGDNAARLMHERAKIPRYGEGRRRGPAS